MYGAPPLDSLCHHCILAECGACPIYPQNTTYCVEFRPMEHARHDAAVLVAGGMRNTRGEESQRRFALLCELIEKKR